MNSATRSKFVQSLFGRATLMLAAVSLAAASLTSCNPPTSPTPKPKIVVLTPLPFDILDASIDGLRHGLADAGYGPDKVELKIVNAGGQMQLLTSYAREIVAERPFVVVPVSTPATQAVVGVAPPSLNVVFSTVTDPAKAKVPAASPNITGVSDVVNYQANVDLLRELFPQARRVGTIYNPGDDAAVFGLERIRPLLASQGFELIVVPATNSNEAVNAARALVGKVDMILIGSDSNAAAAMAGISSVAARARIPVMASDAGSVRSGALAAVSVDYEELGRASATLIVRLLKSGKPAGRLPRVAFVGNRLVLNRETARALGYSFPATVLARKPELVGAQ
jgi:putative ABC transport system substrate-binding protein